MIDLMPHEHIDVGSGSFIFSSCQFAIFCAQAFYGWQSLFHSSVLMDQIYFLFVVVESDEFKYCL